MPLWTPLDLGAALKGWWNADDHGTANMVDDGAGLISSWKDRVSAVNATAVTTARPTWSATSFNTSYAGVTFNGTTNCLVSTAFSALPVGATGGEVWAVTNQADATTTSTFLLRYGGAAGATDRIVYKVNSSGMRFRLGDGPTTLLHTASLFTGLHIVSGNWSGTTLGGRINGVVTTPATAVIATLATGTTRLRIGAGNAGAAANFWVGAIRHIIVTTTLSVAEREQIEGWAAWNSGLVSLLPVGHPYKSNAPTTPATGTLAVVETGNDVAAVSGSVPVSAALSVTETGDDTAAFTGVVAVSGRIATLAATEAGSDTAAFTSTVTPLATRTATLAAIEVGPDTAALAGAVAAAATLAATEVGADAAALAGTVTAFGGRIATLAVTEVGSDIAAFTGAVGMVGRFAALAVTESGVDVAAATGQAIVGVALAALESGDDAAAVTGQVRLSAALATAETGPDVAALSISSAIAASMAATESGQDVARIVLRLRPIQPNIGLAGSLAPGASLSGSVSATLLKGGLQSQASLRGSLSLGAHLQARRSDNRLRGGS